MHRRHLTQVESPGIFAAKAQNMRSLLARSDAGENAQIRGSDLHAAGRFQEAERQFRPALKWRSDKLGQDHTDTLNSKHWLALSLYRQQKYEEAEEHFRQALEGREKTLDRDHADTLNSKNGLAHSLYHHQKYEEAEKHFRQVVKRRERTLGRDHAYTLYSKHWLAQSLYQQQKYGEAEKHFRQALEGREKTLGPDHTDTLSSKHWLAHSLFDQQKYEEAEKHFRQVVKGQEKTLGRDHANTLDSRYWLERVLSSERNHIDTIESSLHNTQSKQEFNQISEDKSRIGSSTWEVPLTSLSRSIRSNHSNSNLDRFFVESYIQRSLYSDSEIANISSLLEHFSPQWSKVPRTYIVLRTINCLNLLDGLLDTGFSDYWFPAREENLCPALSSNQAQDFVRNQHLVLTNSLDLEKGAKGQHCYFENNEIIPLQKQRILGRGGFGQVDEVLSLISYNKYARKRVLRRDVLRGHKPEQFRYFVTEIETLKRLDHRHIVKFVGSYSDTKYLGLVMSPVAETDLCAYLKRSDTSKHSGELRTFFGCLAAALSYLHTQRIRHKDIKPQNILVDRGEIKLTDFGLCLDFTDATGSTTMSMVNVMTPRYCAPEVAEHEPRGTSSDIWSLGLIFLEMLVVLKGQTIAYMNEYLLEHGTRHPYVRGNRRGLLELIDVLKSSGDAADNRPIKWISEMLQEKRDSRLDAAQLMATIIHSREDEYEANRYCGICCAPHDDDDFSD